MTKVRLTEDFLAYPRGMNEFVRKIVRNKYIAGVKTFSIETEFLAQPDLLPPPRVEMIDLMVYQGQVDDLIVLMTTDDFRIGNIRVTIQDEKGNVIESGYASPWADYPGLWDYVTTACVPSGTPVIVCAAATDMLGAVGMLSERITIP